MTQSLTNNILYHLSLIKILSTHNRELNSRSLKCKIISKNTHNISDAFIFSIELMSSAEEKNSAFFS